MAKHVLQALGYDAHQLKTIGSSPVLVRLGIGAEERILVPFATLANGYGTNYPRRGASFLSPLTVRKIVMASTKPAAKGSPSGSLTYRSRSRTRAATC